MLVSISYLYVVIYNYNQFQAAYVFQYEDPGLFRAEGGKRARAPASLYGSQPPEAKRDGVTCDASIFT